MLTLCSQGKFLFKQKGVLLATQGKQLCLQITSFCVTLSFLNIAHRCAQYFLIWCFDFVMLEVHLKFREVAQQYCIIMLLRFCNLCAWNSQCKTNVCPVRLSILEVPLLNIYRNNNKSVKIWAQLVIKIARKKWMKTPLLHKIVCFQMLEFCFKPEAFFRFKTVVEKLPFSKTTLL